MVALSLPSIDIPWALSEGTVSRFFLWPIMLQNTECLQMNQDHICLKVFFAHMFCIK